MTIFITEECREEFEAAYAKHWGEAMGGERTAAQVKELRDGEGYGDRAYLNGMWMGWRLAYKLHEDYRDDIRGDALDRGL